MEQVTCPMCDGTTRRPVPEDQQRYKNIMAGYDPASDTLCCTNCGGQTQWGEPTGKVNPRKDNGQPCIHEYESKKLGNCYHGYTCKHCGFYYTIDSSD